MALPKVHAHGRARRDPQLTADPARLRYEDASGLPTGGLPPGDPAAYGYDAAFVAAAVNPNVVYSNGRAVYVPTDPVAVVREQYCMCAPKTDNERRLMVIVVVLAVVSLALLIALVTLLPMIIGGDDCNDSSENCGGGGGLLDLITSRWENLLA